MDVPSDEDALALTFLSIFRDFQRGSLRARAFVDLYRILLALPDLDWPTFLARRRADGTRRISINVLALLLHALDLRDHLPAVAVTSQTRHNLYLCLKEALNNVVKHSGAGEVTIAMHAAGEKFTLTITDNGRQSARPGLNGANGHGAHHELRVSSGHGLSNIALRVAEMGGTYEFSPAHGEHGARLTVVIALGPVTADKSAPSARRA